MDQNRWRLDPRCFPQRLEIDVSDAAMERLCHLSQRSGRSIRELAEVLLLQAITGAEQG